MSDIFNIEGDMDWVDCSIFLMFSQAHMTDWELDELEIKTINEKAEIFVSHMAGEGMPYTDNDVNQKMKKAFNWYDSCLAGSDEELMSEVQKVADFIKNQDWFNLTFAQTLVDMLADISKADGEVIDNEKGSLESLAKSWGVVLDWAITDDSNKTPGKDDVQRPDPSSYGYDASNTESKEQAVDNDADQETSDENETWNIIHDIGVFYMYFANLAEHPEGDLKDDELNFIGDTFPKWNFTIDDIKYGLQHDNPKDLQTTWEYIFGEMYGNGDPMPRVNESHKNLNNYYKNEIFTLGNIQTFLDTLYNLCMADGTLSKGQIHQLTYYCDQWESVCGYADEIKTKIESMQNNITGAQSADKAWDETEFDVEGKPKEINEGEELISDTRNTGELVEEKKLILQRILANELTKLYPNVDVKKIDDGNYLDIHMPDVHPKRGTHLWFNTPKAGGVKVGFFCRDKVFIEDAIKRNFDTIESYSNGLRPLGHPIFQTVDAAVMIAGSFIKMLIK